MKACLKSCGRKCKKQKVKNVYKRLEQELAFSDWPPVDQVTYASADHLMEDGRVAVENIPLGTHVN